MSGTFTGRKVQRGLCLQSYCGINEMGFTSTTGLRVSDYAKVMAELQEFVENEEAQQEEVVEEE